MTKLSKILAVIMTFFSLVFLGIVSVTSAARTDWVARSKAAKEKLDTLTQKDATGKTEVERNQEEMTRLTFGINQAKQFNQMDLKALQVREEALRAEVERIQKQVSELADKRSIETKKAQKIEREARDRDEDAQALRDQLAEARTERQQSQVEAVKLKDLLVQAQGTLERLQRRQQLLERDGAKVGGKN